VWGVAGTPGAAGAGGNGGTGGAGSSVYVSGYGGRAGDGGKGGDGGSGLNGTDGSNGGNGGTGGNAGANGGAGVAFGGYGGGGGAGGGNGWGNTNQGGANGSSGSLGSPGTNGSPDPAVPEAAPLAPSSFMAASSSNVVAAAPGPQASFLEEIARQFNYIFFNLSQTLNPGQSANSVGNKEITGNLYASSNNGYGVSYSIDELPKYGQFNFNYETGTYTYLVNESLVTPGIQDSFKVTVSNSPEPLPGLLGAVQQALHSWAIDLGIAKPDTYQATIALNVVGTGIYGTPQDQVQYWVKQSYNNCALMAGAMAVGQAYGSLDMKPTEPGIVQLAKITDSISRPGVKMYQDENIKNGLNNIDLGELLKFYGVQSQLQRYETTYIDADGKKVTAATVADGQRAIADLKYQVAQGNPVIVSVNSKTIWDAVKPGQNVDPSQPDYLSPDHDVVVIGIDMTNGMVYLNDSGPEYQGEMENGQLRYPSGEPVPLGAFLSAWQTNSYESLVVFKVTQPQVQEQSDAA
jgi:hypothetical protein